MRVSDHAMSISWWSSSCCTWFRDSFTCRGREDKTVSVGSDCNMSLTLRKKSRW
jgi:hypothetical protein